MLICFVCLFVRSSKITKHYIIIINLINTQGAQPNSPFHAQILDNAMCQPTLKLFLLACPCCSQCLVRRRHLLSSIHVFSYWIEKCFDDE